MLRVVNAVGICALVVLWGVLAVHWGDVPDRVPTHFNAAGLPNAWGPKSALFILPLIGTGMYVMLTAIGRAQHMKLNVPKGVDADQPEVRREVRGLLTVLKTILAVSFAYIEFRSMMTAMGMVDGLGAWMMPVMLGALGATTLVAFKRLRRFRRVE
jgi:uncharacterized membrane protein